MKKNVAYAVVLLVLIAIAGHFVWRNWEQNQVPPEQDFAFKHPDELQKIFLADKFGNKVTLTKEGDVWMVDGKYKVMPVKIDLLLRTLKEFRADLPVPKAAWNNVIKDLSVKSIKIELYTDAHGAPDKVYFVGSPTLSNNGNYMLMQLDGKVADQPFIVSVPGFIGDLSVRFFTHPVDWRDTEVFAYGIDEIKQVTINYPQQPDASFKLDVISKDSFLITGLQDSTDAQFQGRKLYKPGINKFLNSFSFLNAESFENNYVYKDSILSTGPFAEIEVTPKNGGSSKITFYYMPANRRTKEQIDRHGNEITIDPDHYYATFNNGEDFGIAQNFVFGKVLRKRADFYQSK